MCVPCVWGLCPLANPWPTRGGRGGRAYGHGHGIAVGWVCDVMDEACECRVKAPGVQSAGACMHSSLTEMGVSVHVDDERTFAHPNALGPRWQLGILLRSFWATATRKVTSTLIHALCNALPFISTWAGMLLSTVAWMQVALLSAYPATPPPLLSKLCPCPSYSGRRDRINLVPNLIWYQMQCGHIRHGFGDKFASHLGSWTDLL